MTEKEIDQLIQELLRRSGGSLAHALLTEAHGATGAVMGTANVQTVSNKTMDESNEYGGTDGSAVFEADGFLRLEGDATGFADVEFPQAVPKAVGAGNPTLTALIGGIKGYAYAIGDVNPFDPREIVHLSKLESQAFWHIHFISMANDGTDRFIKWQLEFTPEPETGAYLGTTTISLEILIPANTTAKTPFRVDLGEFTIDFIARLMHCTLTRIVASGTAPSIDPIVGGVHFHYEIDTPAGSRLVLTK